MVKGVPFVDLDQEEESIKGQSRVRRPTQEETP